MLVHNRALTLSGQLVKCTQSKEHQAKKNLVNNCSSMCFCLSKNQNSELKVSVPKLLAVSSKRCLLNTIAESVNRFRI